MEGLFLTSVLVLFVISEGIIINCNLSKHFDLTKYTCEAFNLNIEVPNTKITKVNGNFDRNYISKDVQMLEVKSQLMIYLPQCSKVFPNLDTLLIEDCRQQFLLESDFSTLLKLEYIHLRDGDIKEIHATTFDKTPLVWFILIESHQIKTLPNTIFHKLPKLREVSFYKNKIEILDGSLFQNNHHLKKVKFHDNRIQFIGLEFFDYFNKHSDVWLQHNECINMKTSLDLIKKMKEYIISNCRIMPIITLIDTTTVLPPINVFDLILSDVTSEDLGSTSTITENYVDTEPTSLVIPVSTDDSKNNDNYDILKLILIVFFIIIVLQSIALIICGIKNYKMKSQQLTSITNDSYGMVRRSFNIYSKPRLSSSFKAVEDEEIYSDISSVIVSTFPPINHYDSLHHT